jgi:copper chaperone CopZ
MKNVILSVAIIAVIGLTSCKNQAKKEAKSTTTTKASKVMAKSGISFGVRGNCGMCKNTIEKAAKGVEGVSSAIWNTDTKMLQVTFDEHEISLDEIKQKIAAVGYDTDKFRAPDKVYNGLMGCCKYDRPKK